MTEPSRRTHTDRQNLSRRERRFLLLLDFYLARTQRHDIAAALRRSLYERPHLLAPHLAAAFTAARRGRALHRAAPLFDLVVKSDLGSYLKADDLLWVADNIEPLHEQLRICWCELHMAMDQWIRWHGLISPPLVIIVEQQHRKVRSLLLDVLVLWIEPTPERWEQYALDTWSSHLASGGFDYREPPADPACFLSWGHHDQQARNIIRSRGHSARRALRAALRRGGEAAAILQRWVQQDERDS